MRWSRVVPASLAVALGLGCSETGVEVADLVGTWEATQFEFFDAAGGDPVLSFDVVATGGTVTVVLGADSTYEFTFQMPFGDPEVDTGTWAVDGSTLTLTSSQAGAEVTVLEVELNGDTLTITADDMEFDLDEDGTDDPVTLEATFVRG